ncbi:MAG: hypothetical protein ACJ76J_19540 [Thermoanaerobaculia bacterium]
MKRIPLLLLLFAACAAPSTKPVTRPEVNRVPRVSLFCSPSARRVRFDAMGVPSDELPISVALDSRYAYVLFTSRLLRVPLEGSAVEPEMTIGRGQDLWIDMDLDPVDGSVWIATDKALLRHITPGWESRKLDVRMEDEGGFDGIRVGRDAIYATPVCAKDAVWRLDRSGNLLGSAFALGEIKIPDEPVHPMELRCSKVRLERDAQGDIVAWDYGRRKVWRVDGQGSWSETDPGFFEGVSIHPSTAKGVDLGTATEQWYVAGRAHSLFYWKGRPVFLGNAASGGSTGTTTVLILPGKGSPRDALDECGGKMILSAATTAERYAAITGEELILGEMAGAPSLP